MATAHNPAITYPLQQGANRCQVITWGLPTQVPYPGSAKGNFPPVDPNSAAIVAWAVLVGGDTCVAVFCPALVDRSVQVTGTASGASITIQGSNDGTNFVTLHDVNGNALSSLAPGDLKQIGESCLWLKALVVGGGGSTALNVIVAGKKPS